jgi:hypothetical protein
VSSAGIHIWTTSYTCSYNTFSGTNARSCAYISSYNGPCAYTCSYDGSGAYTCSYALSGAYTRSHTLSGAYTCSYGT